MSTKTNSLSTTSADVVCEQHQATLSADAPIRDIYHSMRLVHEFDITAQDLPYIEQNQIASYKLKSYLNTSFPVFEHINNLNMFLDNGLCACPQHGGFDTQFNFARNHLDNHKSVMFEHLIEQVTNGNVLLVHEQDGPLAPIVRFLPHSDGQAGGQWHIDTIGMGRHDLSPHIIALFESLPPSQDIPASSGVTAKYSDEPRIEPALRELNPEVLTPNSTVNELIPATRLLSLQLVDTEGSPYDNTEYLLHIDNREWQGSSDGNGVIEEKIPNRKTKASLHIWPDKDKPKDLIILEIDI